MKSAAPCCAKSQPANAPLRAPASAARAKRDLAPRLPYGTRGASFSAARKVRRAADIG